MSAFSRFLARSGAYLITSLLAVVWLVDGLDSLMRPLFDLGRDRVGDTIILFARLFALSPEGTLAFAHLLAGLKLMTGAFLVQALIVAAYQKVRWGVSDDAMLDVALFIAALASAAAAVPGLTHGGDLLMTVIGELMLCVIASMLAIYGRGYVATEERPRPARPEPVIVSAG